MCIHTIIMFSLRNKEYVNILVNKPLTWICVYSKSIQFTEVLLCEFLTLPGTRGT